MQPLVPRLQSLVTSYLGFVRVKPVYTVYIVLYCYPSIEEEKNLCPFYGDPMRMIPPPPLQSPTPCNPPPPSGRPSLPCFSS